MYKNKYLKYKQKYLMLKNLKGGGRDHGTCAICYDDDKDMLIRDNLHNCLQLNCFHVFHYKCIINWMKEKLVCPVCKVPITKIYNPTHEMPEVNDNKLIESIHLSVDPVMEVINSQLRVMPSEQAKFNEMMKDSSNSSNSSNSSSSSSSSGGGGGAHDDTRPSVFDNYFKNLQGISDIDIQLIEQIFNNNNPDNIIQQIIASFILERHILMENNRLTHSTEKGKDGDVEAWQRRLDYAKSIIDNHDVHFMLDEILTEQQRIIDFVKSMRRK
jgi:hypothetical protein